MTTKTFAKIIKPTFVVNRERAIRNIEWLASKLEKSNTLFRPHFKTHQSIEIGQWFSNVGIHQISVSSVDMAWYFYQAGWKDISIVFPFNPREIDRINTMSSKANINILIEDAGTLEYVSTKANHQLGVFIKIDCGYQRTGIKAENTDDILALAQLINSKKKLEFKGILSHFGNTYSAKTKEDIRRIYEQSLAKMTKLKALLQDDFPNTILSIGDTPSSSIISDFSGVDEIRAGNFVFYDWMQKEIGSCSTKQIAAIVLCPVVAKHKDRNELVIHGGAVHFSKEKGNEHFGQIVDISNGFGTNPVSGVYLKSLSQEHGIIKCNNAFFEKTKIGDLVGIVPIHSCLTANLMKSSSVIV